jgi:uncharacterized membrane protein YphA (DoxX/SURF4 family)
MRFILGHEAYVLDNQTFQSGLQNSHLVNLRELINPAYLPVMIGGLIFILGLFGLALWLSLTPVGLRLTQRLESYGRYTVDLVRVAAGLALIWGAIAGSFFGPELALAGAPGGSGLRLVMIVIGLMLLLGWFSQAAGWLGLAVLSYGAFYWHSYILTYLSFAGIFLALMLFGGGRFSIDHQIFKWPAVQGRNLITFNDITRWTFALALIYTAVTIKFLHPQLSQQVYLNYHLDKIFHLSPVFFVIGAGLMELMVGSFILVGFASRTTVLILLTVMTLALLNMHEPVWPHLVLYGLSLAILIMPKSRLTIDYYLASWLKRRFG